MEPVYAVIGCGNISRFHFDGLQKVGAKVARVVDLNLERALPIAGRFGAKAGTDWREAVNDPAVTAIVVLSHGPSHLQICLAAIAAGKDVICEKTLSNSPDEATQIARAATEKGVLFFTAYMKRFFPAFVKTQELLPSLGTCFSAYVRTYQKWGNMYENIKPGAWMGALSSYGGALLKCGGSHTLDLTMALFGRPVSLYGCVDYVEGSPVDRKANALLHYPRGLLVHFEVAGHPLDRIGYERNGWDERIEINGTQGRLDFYTVCWDHPENNGSLVVHYDNRTGASTEYRCPAENNFHTEVAYFHECIKARRQGRPSVVDGFNVDVVIGAIEESSRLRRPVEIDWRGL